jgi:valyl-tRNA synthetase
MSKSKGNVIDPLEIIDKYGADAFRFTLAALAAQGRDIRLSEDRIEGYRHFCNKLWNAHQFLNRYLPLLEGSPQTVVDEGGLKIAPTFDLADRWLLHRLHELIGLVTKALEEYRFNEAASALYQFVWHEYCDWYLEIVKSRLTSESSLEQRRTGVALLCLGLDTALRLLHPFMPFITEEIWQQLPQHGTSLMVAEWPKADPGWQDANAEVSMGFLMDLTRATRDLRSDLEFPPSKSIRLVLRTSSDTDDRAIDAVMPYLAALARAEHVTFGRHMDRPSSAAVALVGGIEVHLPVDDPSVFAARQQKLRRELDKVEQERARVEKKLCNADFMSKAPEEVVSKVQGEHARLMDTKTKLLQHLERIEHLLK